MLSNEEWSTAIRSSINSSLFLVESHALACEQLNESLFDEEVIQSHREFVEFRENVRSFVIDDLQQPESVLSGASFVIPPLNSA
jgi:hypothetical protein